MNPLFRVASLLLLATLPIVLSHAQTPALVERLVVMGSGAAVEVEIQASKAVTPQSQIITGPDRIIVDFPGALPAAELRSLNVHRGALKAIRAGLFSTNPPITRVVLDLSEPQAYQIFSVRNMVMLKVGPLKGGVAKITNASLTSTTAPIAVLTPVSNETAPAPPPKPPLDVSFQNGLLTIHTERATLSQVLFEVQRQTGAEIAIPAGAENEEIAVELGPAPAREVLAALLNGSRYNFIFVGNNRGRTLQKAILSVR